MVRWAKVVSEYLEAWEHLFSVAMAAVDRSLQTLIFPIELVEEN